VGGKLKEKRKRGKEGEKKKWIGKRNIYVNIVNKVNWFKNNNFYKFM
jgi:hypothetical protein